MTYLKPGDMDPHTDQAVLREFNSYRMAIEADTGRYWARIACGDMHGARLLRRKMETIYTRADVAQYREKFRQYLRNAPQRPRVYVADWGDNVPHPVVCLETGQVLGVLQPQELK